MIRFQFGQVVVIEDNLIGVICKTWLSETRGPHYDVYIRYFNFIREYQQDEIKAYIYNKELTDDELNFYDANDQH